MSRMIHLRRPSALSGLIGVGLLAASAMLWSGVAGAKAAPDSFAALAKRVSPAVVNVATARDIAPPREMPELPPGSPFEEFFKRFGAPTPQGRGEGESRRAIGLGSGFIVDPSGYIVTNNHVVDKASEVKVRLGDDSSFTAKVIGVDPQTDLALLKVEAGRPLPAVKLGDSDKAEVGDWVLAVGNPFGLGGSVTAGIISARGRNIQAGPYDDFLQVDASINRGNSGGPLFNVDGEVIGVNTAIYSPNGGSVGIGFAIPSNLVKSVVAALQRSGKVERGWLGVSIQEVTPEIADSLGLDGARGALIADLQPDGPAAKAGLRQGDVLLGFGGRPVSDSRELARLVAEKQAGSDVEVEIWRDGASRQLGIVTGKQPANPRLASAGRPERETESYRSTALKAELAALTDAWRTRLGIDAGVNGVVVLSVEEGPVAGQGLREGDVIVRVAGTAVDTPERLDAVINKAKEGKEKAVLMLVNRQGRDLFLGLKLGLA
jgi:serine protease Do